MGTLLLIGAAALAGFLVWSHLAREQARQLDAERHPLAAKLGLTYAPGSFQRDPTLMGTLAGLPVEVSWTTKVVGAGKFKRIIHCTEYVLGGLPDSLVVRAEGLGTGLKKVFIGSDRKTGDEPFDRLVYLRGDELDAAVFCDRELRGLAREVAATDAQLQGGRLTLEVEGRETPDEVEARLALFGSFGERVCRARGNLPALLLGAVERGDNAGRALQLLLEEHPGAEETERARRIAERSTDPQIRAAAAASVGDGEALLAVVCELEVPARVRAEALGHLLRSEDLATRWLGPRSEPALIALLDAEDPFAQSAAAEALGISGSVAAVEALLARTRGLLADGEVKAAASSAVKRIQGRLSGAARGQLSVAPAPAAGGALSVAVDAQAGGAVSVPADRGNGGAPLDDKKDSGSLPEARDGAATPPGRLREP